MAEDFEVGGPPPEEETSNRPFLLAAGGIGLLIIISIGCLAAYALFLAPRQALSAEARLTLVAAQNTEVALQITQTAGARFPSPTTPPTRTPVPNTSTPTRVVLVASPTTPPTIDPAQATANALATHPAPPPPSPPPASPMKRDSRLSSCSARPWWWL